MSSFYPRRYAEFLRALREERERAGITQRDLAAKLQLMQSQISKCESGDRRLDPVELVYWLRSLDADPVTFLGLLADRMASSSPVGTVRASKGKSKEPISSAPTKSGIVDPVTGKSWSGRGRMPAWAKALADVARKHQGVGSIAEPASNERPSVDGRPKKK